MRGGVCGGEMRERDQKKEHKLAIICQCRKQRKCSKSYSSKRQGQHWWSELFVFLLTSFIPNEMGNQSDVVLQKHFTPFPHQRSQIHNWFPNTKRQTVNPYSIILTHKKWQLSEEMLHKKQQNIHCLLNHTLMSIIPIQTNKVCNWQRATAKNKTST